MTTGAGAGVGGAASVFSTGAGIGGAVTAFADATKTGGKTFPYLAKAQ